MSGAFCIIAVFSFIEPGFSWLLPCVPFGLFLVYPVVKAMKEPEYKTQFVDAINTRAIILAAAMLGVYGFTLAVSYV
jgi:hypothetical protein